MGKKYKKKRRTSSRSSSSESDRHSKKHKKHKHRYSSDDSSDDSSPERHHRSKHHKKHKHRSQSRDHGRRSRSRSTGRKKHKINPEDLERLQEERRIEKERLKAMENPEEKRARRLAKKEAKERKRKAQMGWDEEYMGYTNTDNPFGDEHLLDTFVWTKKMDKTGIKIYTKADLESMQKQKMIENKIELEKVKKRRLERERTMEERELEREKLQREKETEYYREWEKQEDNFHLNQAKLRSKIRIEDGRAKPIDLLAKYISAEEDELSIEMNEPYTYLNGLTIQDLEDLLEDIKVYMELDDAKNHEYWKDITIVAEDELEKLRKIDPLSTDFIGERRSGINHSVEEDVISVFKGKTQQQLQILEDTIKSKLKGGEGIDIGYWESLLGQLRAHRARTRLREKHQEELRRQLFKLKQQQGIDSQPLFPIMKQEGSRPGSRSGSPVVRSGSPAIGSGSSAVRSGSPAIRLGSPAVRSGSPAIRSGSPTVGSASPAVGSGSPAIASGSPAVASGSPFVESDFKTPGLLSSKAETSEDPQPGTSRKEETTHPEEEESVLTEQDLDEQSYEEYDAGCYSPRLIRMKDLEPDTIVYDPIDDIKRLEYARMQLIKIGKAKMDTDKEFIKRAQEGMNDDEAQFSVEVPLEKQTVLWSDKYRPRKPRFFNRVHTGFEWNKYNQTHYDIDNPPPKIVQGYKFNIFYPDLIDKTQTPEYTLTPYEANKDFAALRFKAGPPYEDIAFKIVNREWEYSYKRGFRCQFHNNIFQLWFHFKRYRYRR